MGGRRGIKPKKKSDQNIGIMKESDNNVSATERESILLCDGGKCERKNKMGSLLFLLFKGERETICGQSSVRQWQNQREASHTTCKSRKKGSGRLEYGRQKTSLVKKKRDLVVNRHNPGGKKTQGIRGRRDSQIKKRLWELEHQKAETPRSRLTSSIKGKKRGESVYINSPRAPAVHPSGSGKDALVYGWVASGRRGEGMADSRMGRVA